MKRFAVHESEMARVLMLLSHGQEPALPLLPVAGRGDRAPERVFVCKTCNRTFPSFQALGGHRASHKKPRLDGDGDPSLAKPKLHGCSICGLEFAIGQALGGHMRRHRAEAEADTEAHSKARPPALEKACDVAGGICLDLNLTPSENCAKCRSVVVLGAAGQQGVHKALAMLDCSL